MNKFNFSWGVLIAAIVLLAYTYITFNGCLYLWEGALWKSFLASAVLLVIVCLCVFTLCKAKATRWKSIGATGQLIFGSIILASFFFAGIPFASFLNAVGNINKINQQVKHIQDAAIELDNRYILYVNTRVDNYAKTIINTPHIYNNAGGDTDSIKIANMTESLKWHLLPSNLDSVKQERRNWLNSIDNLSIWNIQTPKNLLYFSQCVEKWIDQYKNIASITYPNEDNNEFIYTAFDESYQSLHNNLSGIHYSWWSVIVAILCSFIMLVPYFITRTSLAGYEGKQKKSNKNQYYE